MKLHIRHKLFITIFLTSSIVACGLFFFLQWNFDRGFLNYVNNQELKKLDKMAQKVAVYYTDEHGWAKLRDNHRLWLQLMMNVAPENVSGKLKPGGMGHGPFKDFPPPRPLDPTAFGKRLLLIDVNNTLVMGGGPIPRDINLKDLTLVPIIKEKKTVGHLGLISATELSDTGDLLFVEQQTETFGLVTLLMLCISILLTFPVAIHLLRPINHLTEGTQKLIGGKFTTRIPVTSKDELGRLSEHFNLMAMTLEKNEKARQRWIADISHELRTPLAVLRGELEALLDGVRKTGPNTLQPLHSEVLHMQHLVNDLYELSMSDIGALTYRKIPVDPIGILAGALELFDKRFNDKGVELQVHWPEKPSISLLGDPDRLQQLFTNLLENSLRYTDAPGMLKITAEESHTEMTISFEDTKPGVTEDQLPLLFERLYRTDPSRNRAGSGAGLGLSICTNIVEAHQGKISSYASPHGGLGIRITLPFTL